MPIKLFLAILIIVSLAISRGYGIQLKYSILNDQPKQQFYPPFLLMWFNNSCLVCLLAKSVWAFPVYFSDNLLSSLFYVCQNFLFEFFSSNYWPFFTNFQQIQVQNWVSLILFYFFQKNHSKFLCAQFIFLLLFNVNNYTNSLSLGRISTSAALSIHSLEVSIVYILGRFFLKEQFFLLKVKCFLIIYKCFQ